MDLYRKRMTCLAVSAVILFIMIIAIVVSCSKNGPSDEETSAQTDVQETTAAVVSTVTEPVVTSVTRAPVSGFISKNRLDFADTDFVPDDILYINPEYLDEIIVVGDSIAKGYGVYNRLPAQSVLAAGSVGIRNAMESLFEYNGDKRMFLDVLEIRKPKYIFISLGMNDLNFLSEEDYTKKYKETVSEIMKKTPDSKLIVMSITPVTESNEFTDNKKIDDYNEALRKMVYDIHNSSVFYLDAAQSLKNDRNNLKEDLSSGDGIHLAGSAYDTLLSYMLTMLEWI